jgi:hypothetical protein
MCKSLSKNTFPTTGSLNALNLLSLEGLLAIVASLSSACHRDRRDDADAPDAAAGRGGVNAEQLRVQKVRRGAAPARAVLGAAVDPGNGRASATRGGRRS